MKRQTTPMRGWFLVTALAVGIAALTGYRYFPIKIVLILALIVLVAILQATGWATSALRRFKTRRGH